MALGRALASPLSRRGLLALTGALVVVVAATAGVLAWRDDDGRLAAAAALAPADAERVSWTDWAGVRAALGTPDGAEGEVEVRRLLEAGFEQDLTSASALGESAEVLESRFGFSPLTVEWELFSQSSAGAVVIVRLSSAEAVDDVAQALSRIGYAAPAAAEDGVWRGGDDLLAAVGGVTPELQYVALDRGAGLLLASDRAAYLESVVSGDRGLDEPMAEAIGELDDPVSAVGYTGEHACRALAMSGADEAAQREAEGLIAEAGGLSPLAAYAMGALADGDVRVVMAFESEEQARRDAAARARLARGAAPGQGGSFADRFEVRSATATGRLATLELAPRPGAYVLSDLSSGPVLFASC